MVIVKIDNVYTKHRLWFIPNNTKHGQNKCLSQIITDQTKPFL